MRLLVADDNADMRAYLTRLLQPFGTVEVACDGLEALAAVERQMPDLIVSDVMMPNLDGFDLVRALREDPRTGALPIMLVSARAGEDARVDGALHGADDYIVKPFSARELVARVQAQLRLARLRRESGAALTVKPGFGRGLRQRRMSYRMSPDGRHMLHLVGRDFIRSPTAPWLDKYIPTDEQPRVTEAIDEAVRGKRMFELEHRVLRVDGSVGWTLSRAIPLLGADGEVLEWFGAASDITARKGVEEALRESEERQAFLLRLSDALRRARRGNDGCRCVEATLRTSGPRPRVRRQRPRCRSAGRHRR